MRKRTTYLVFLLTFLLSVFAWFLVAESDTKTGIGSYSLTRTLSEISLEGELLIYEEGFIQGAELFQEQHTLQRQSILWQNIFPVMATGSISLGYDNKVFFGGAGGSAAEPPVFALYSSETPGAIWTFLSNPGSNLYVSASKTEDIFAGIEYHPDNDLILLHRWTSSSNDPVWTYNFDDPHYAFAGQGAIQISYDNSVIVVGLRNTLTGSSLIYVFETDSSTPVETHEIPQNNITTLRLSDDGNLVGFHTTGPPTAKVFDRGTGEIRGLVIIPANNTNFAMCGNGEYILTGWQEAVISKWNGTFYQEIYRHSDTDGTWYHNQGLISADGSTAIIYANRSDYELNRIYLINLINVEEVWSYEFSRAPGSTLQMNPSFSSISRDGHVFAMSNWGDDSPDNPALQIFTRDEAEPVFTLSPSPEGSIQVVSISDYAPYYVAAAGKTVHMNTWGSGTNIFSIDLELNIDYAQASGNVTDEETGLPIDNARAVLGEWDFLYSDSQGYGEFNYIIPGSYELIVSKTGYATTVIDNLIVEPGESYEMFIELSPLPTIEVSGTVSGSDNPASGLEGATVRLRGYQDYEFITGDSGEFLLTGVYVNNYYTLSINHPYYDLYEETISIGTENLSLGSIILPETLFPVSEVEAQLNVDETEVEITWSDPVMAVLRNFKYDNGERTGGVGFTTGTSNSVLGAVHRHDSVLLDISWHLSGTTEHNQVDLFVFGLDENGAPLSTSLLLHQPNLDNVHDEWNNYELPSPLEAENGFLIGLSASAGGHLGISIDDGTDLTPNTQYYIFDYTSGASFTAYSTGNFFIRAWGYDYGSIDFPMFSLRNKNQFVSSIQHSRIFEGYSIYRFALENQDDNQLWDYLGTTTDNVFTDSHWSTLDVGHYRYAVRALYSNDQQSPAALSNILQKGSAEIIVTPEAFNLEVEAGTTHTLPLTITNTGDAALEYSISITQQTRLRKSEISPSEHSLSTFFDYQKFNSSGELQLDSKIAPSENKPFNTRSDETIKTREPVEIHYDSGYTGNGVGTGGAASWISAVRFTDEELQYYYGDYSLTGIKLYIRDPQFTEVEVLIWEGGTFGDPGSIIYSQDITSSVTVNDWTTYHLSYPVELADGNEYWIGYAITATGDHPSGVDIGPMVEGKGGWMYFNNVWSQLPELNETLNFNWCLRGLLEEEVEIWLTADPESGIVPGGESSEINVSFDATELLAGTYQGLIQIFNNSPVSPVIVPVEMIVTGEPPIFNPPLNLAFDETTGLLFWDPPEEPNSGLLGYNIYLDENHHGFVDDNNFYFVDLEYMQTYIAGVEAVYEMGTSEVVTLEFTWKLNSAEENPDIITRLKGNFPNPFNPETIITFSLDKESPVEIEVFNLKGEKIYSYVFDALPSGQHFITWDGRNNQGSLVSSGVYFYRMTANEYISTRKMLLLK